jgi:hypothetical protein
MSGFTVTNVPIFFVTKFSRDNVPLIQEYRYQYSKYNSIPTSLNERMKEWINEWIEFWILHEFKIRKATYKILY